MCVFLLALGFVVYRLCVRVLLLRSGQNYRAHTQRKRCNTVKSACVCVCVRVAAGCLDLLCVMAVVQS